MVDKFTTRNAGKAYRLGLGAGQRETMDRAIVMRCQGSLDWEHYANVMVFVPIVANREINIWPLIYWIWEKWPQVVVYAPQVRGHAMGAARLGSDTPLRTGAYGTVEPPGASELLPSQHLDLILTPLLGFDLAGHRVGYGKGYYDRFFATHPTAQRIGLGYEQLLVAGTIATAPHDIPLAGVITEDRFIDFAKSKLV